MSREINISIPSGTLKVIVAAAFAVSAYFALLHIHNSPRDVRSCAITTSVAGGSAFFNTQWEIKSSEPCEFVGGRP